jgi:hypothetical protein
MYDVPNTGKTNGKIVFTHGELMHLFGRYPTEDKEFRVKMEITDAGDLAITNVPINQAISRNVSPWLHPYGKDDWSVSLTQPVRDLLSRQAYCKDKGSDRESFIPVHVVKKPGLLLGAVSLRSGDVQAPEAEPSLQERAYEAVRVINSFAEANEGRIGLTLHNGRLQLWTTPVVT